ncbi:hypothetical protein KZ940_32900, partial [Pseudomonas aeruginosa]|nr:hypothetical protein [Pseudomonas aeruginosa]
MITFVSVFIVRTASGDIRFDNAYHYEEIVSGAFSIAGLSLSIHDRRGTFLARQPDETGIPVVPDEQIGVTSAEAQAPLLQQQYLVCLLYTS